jgi:hypothetical protein
LVNQPHAVRPACRIAAREAPKRNFHRIPPKAGRRAPNRHPRVLQWPRRPALAIRHLVPAIYEFRHFCGAGGLISWLASTPDVFSRATSQPNYRPAP